MPSETPRGPGVFICYASEDGGLADDLYFELSRRFGSIWYDKYSVEAGDSLLVKIEEGIRSSTYFVILLTSNSLTKPWVQRELRGALSLEVVSPNSAPKIIPVLVDAPRELLP